MGPRSWILHHGASTFVMRQCVHMTFFPDWMWPVSLLHGHGERLRDTIQVYLPRLSTFLWIFLLTRLTLSILQGYGPWTGYTNLVLILAYLDLLYPRYLSSYFNDILLLQWYGPIAWHNNLDTNFSILDFVRSSATWAWDNWLLFCMDGNSGIPWTCVFKGLLLVKTILWLANNWVFKLFLLAY